MAELLTKEQLESYAELFKVNTGPPFGYVDKAVKAGNALLAHCRALEAERDRLRLPIRAQATVETAMKQAVGDFRQRAIEAVRAHVNKYDDHYMHYLTKCIPELLQSLPATSERKHVLLTTATCPCKKQSDTSCNVCDGGLAVCSVCGKAEAELDGPCVATSEEVGRE